MFYQYFALAFTIILSAYVLCKYIFFKSNEKFARVMNRVLKICVITYCIIIILSILLPDAFVRSYDPSELDFSYKNVSFALVRWFSALSFVMLPLAVFFKNRTIKNIAIYFCSIMTIISIIYYSTYMEYYTSTLGRGLNSISVFSQAFKNFLLNTTFRSFVIGFVWLLELFVVIMLAVEEKHIFNFKDKKEYLNYFLVLFVSLLCVIPIYVPQHLFGYSNIIFDAWTIPHIIWVLFVIGLIISLYYIFRNKSTEVKTLVCFVLALSLFYQYNQMFGVISISVKRLPFQLCNIGAFLVLLALITKNKHIFNFTVIVNVVGVMFALAMPDLDGKGLFYLYNMHFIFEHTNVLVVPVLALCLQLFPRLDKTALKDCIIGFSIYFVFVLITGTLFNTIASITNDGFYSANYLFMFDQKVATDFVEPFGKLFNTQLHIGKHITLYPVIQSLVYVVFLALCVGMYYLIRLIYLIKDKIKKQKT